MQRIYTGELEVLIELESTAQTHSKHADKLTLFFFLLLFVCLFLKTNTSLDQLPPSRPPSHPPAHPKKKRKINESKNV